MFNRIKKNLLLSGLIAALLSFSTSALSAPAEADSVVDDSIRDISIVLGMGAVGALLGLSTLSFVESPSKHTKNIAVGGAMGIVFGVGVVIFGQATKTSSAIDGGLSEIPMNPDKFEAETRREFSQELISKNYLKQPDLAYSFSF